MGEARLDALWCLHDPDYSLNVTLTLYSVDMITDKKRKTSERQLNTDLQWLGLSTELKTVIF